MNIKALSNRRRSSTWSIARTIRSSLQLATPSHHTPHHHEHSAH